MEPIIWALLLTADRAEGADGCGCWAFVVALALAIGAVFGACVVWILMR